MNRKEMQEFILEDVSTWSESSLLYFAEEEMYYRLKDLDDEELQETIQEIRGRNDE